MSDSNGRRPPGVDEEGSMVSGPRSGRQLTTFQKVAIPLGLGVVFVGVIWVEHLTGSRPQPKQRQVQVPEFTQNFRPAPVVVPPPPPPVRPLPLPPPTAARPSILPSFRHEMTAAESPIFAFSGGALQQVAGNAAAGATNAVPKSAAGAPPTRLTAKLTATIERGTKASLLPHPDMVVTKGTIIPCTLQTAINTELPGYVKCVLPQDVRSTTGDVVLLDRGTIVVGEVQQGLLNGQDRVFVTWDRAETPDHAIIEIDSEGTDELGRAGVPGGLDNHFWARYGSAILLTLIDGSIQVGSSLASNQGSGTGVYLNNFQGSNSSIADTALQANINIPPTLYVNQGDNVGIFVVRDLDFSDVYKLRLTAASAADTP